MRRRPQTDPSIAAEQRSGVRLVLLGALAFLLAAMALLSLPQLARAGTYMVRECDTPQTGNYQPGAPDLSYDGAFGTYYQDVYGCGSSNFINGLGIATNMASAPGSYAAWNFIAPAGTRFTGGYADLSFNNEGGYEPRFSLSNGATHHMVHTQDTSGWAGFAWGPPFANTNLPYAYTNQATLWMACMKTGGNYCQGQNSGDYAFGRQFLFSVEDYTSPSTGALAGSLVSGGWKSGVAGVAYSGSDGQSGVELLDIEVNGSLLGRETPACDHVGGGWFGRFRPCPSSHSMSRAYAVSQAPFAQGVNTVRGCVHDLATSGGRNSECTSQTVNVDTIAPGPVGNLAIAGGDGWRALNDFELGWGTPENEGGSRAPIAGAWYRVVKPGGGYDSGPVYVAGATGSLELERRLPAAGEYEVRVWLQDVAGNASAANARSATLRYDPTVPPDRAVAYSGWISRAELDHMLRWEPVRPESLGPSGLAGYAISVTRDPSSDPCVTADDHDATCSAGEVDSKGVADTTMPVSAQDVPEGRWYAHIVPVTGAGVRASQIGHTAMPVDTTDPVSTTHGVPSEWTNADVTVRVSATDELSGMSPSGDRVDPQPRTCLQIGDAGPECEPDADLTRVVAGEGSHRLRYFARDLAGNENDGQAIAKGGSGRPPGTATVRIDRTPPRIAFAARDPEAPATIVAEVEDPLSGVASGVIEMRRYGSRGSWLDLETRLSGSRLEADAPDDLDPGRYEFRAMATDRAGNAAGGNRRADGSVAVEELPLKELVRLSVRAGAPASGSGVSPGRPGCGGGKARRGRGRCGAGRPQKQGRADANAVTVPYGAPVQLSGTLLTASDRPLRERELTVAERLADGGMPQARSRTIRTDTDGNYAVELAPGPSRTVTVSFEGDRRYRPTRSAPVEVQVPAKLISFKSPRTVGEQGAIRFRGRVGVAGVDIGGVGKRIELQYEKAPRSWPTIDSAQARPDGRFDFRYPLRSDYLRPTRVRFRVVVPPELAWPYAGVAVSRPRATVILP